MTAPELPYDITAAVPPREAKLSTTGASSTREGSPWLPNRDDIERLTSMTITEFTTALAAQVRAEGVDGSALRMALQLAVQLWLDIERPPVSEVQWGLFATEVQSVADRLYPHPPETAVALDLAQIGPVDECNAAIRQLIGAAVEVLQAAGRQADLVRAWDYAAAGQRLQNAVNHLP